MLLGITMITFLIANLAPGDPISALISPEDQLNEEDLERMRRALGLDKPIPIRYVIWVKELVTGNFGFSYFTKQPVLDRVIPRLLPTIELTGVALLISLLVGVGFGVISALRQYSVWDYSLSVLSLIGLSIPTFFFGLVALLVFGLLWPVLPVFGMSSGETDLSLDGQDRGQLEAYHTAGDRAVDRPRGDEHTLCPHRDARRSGGRLHSDRTL